MALIVNIPATTASSAAPNTATYLTQVPDATLTAEQAMSALATGLVKNTTATGVQSIGVANADFLPAVPPAIIDGTGLTTTVPLLVKNGKAASGYELQVTGSVRSGYCINDSGGTQRAVFGYAVANNEWFTGSTAGDLVLLCDGAKRIHFSALASVASFLQLDGGTGRIGFGGAQTTGNIVTFYATFGTGVSFLNTVNLVFGTSTGSKIGTGATQLIGFWNATPVVQPASTGTTTAGFTANASANAVFAESTFTGNTGATAYTISDVVKNLKTAGLLAA